MWEERICFSPYSLKLTTVLRRYLSVAIVLAREDVEVHLQAPQTKTEHFWLCAWAKHRLLKNCVIVMKQHRDDRTHPVT